MEIAHLYNICAEFVKQNTAGRDSSHGYEHMQRVANYTLKVANDYPEDIKKYALVCAWTHDVADHKYGRAEELMDRCKMFYTKLQTQGLISSDINPEKMVDIIKRVSFSNETRMRNDLRYAKSPYRTDWLEVLGEDGTLIRNIVSDADKLDALGEDGVERIEIYARNNITEESVTEHTIRIGIDRIIPMYEQNYFKTPVGINMAKDMHNRFIRRLYDKYKDYSPRLEQYAGY